jgi:hypothetical protein
MVYVNLFSGMFRAFSLLSQYQFCAGGTISGVLYGMKFPTGRLGRYTPFLVGGIAGSLADLMYGYNVACIREVAAEREYRHKGGTKSEH